MKGSDIATDFLYSSPLYGGFPDNNVMIGVDFEAGGCYETWGFVIYKKIFDDTTMKYDLKTISEGRSLEQAIANARKTVEEK